MFPILSPNLTLAEKYQTLTQISKARALHLQATMSTNSSEPLVPNTIRSPVGHAFSDFFYTQIYSGTSPQKANLHIDTAVSLSHGFKGKNAKHVFRCQYLTSTASNRPHAEPCLLITHSVFFQPRGLFLFLGVC